VVLAEALRELALDPSRRTEMAAAARERARRFAWPTVASEVLGAYEDAIELASSTRAGATGTAAAAAGGRGVAVATRTRLAVRVGAVSADGLPRVPPKRLRGLEPAPQRSLPRRALGLVARALLVAIAAAGIGLVLLALQRVGLAKVLASLVASKPGLLAVGFGLMCAAMVGRALAWHSILRTAATWRAARMRDALEGTFIGVWRSATLPVRLGETSRAVVVARRIGRARETLPLVLETIVSQTLLNLLALSVLAACGLATVDLLSADGIIVVLALTPVIALAMMLLAPILLMPEAQSGARRHQLEHGVGIVLERLHAGLALLRHRRAAATAVVLQLSAWALQWLACWVLALALGLPGEVSLGAAAAVLFAVNATAVVPATPGNVIVFQAACVAVLSGAYHVPGAEAVAYGIVLQLIELLAAAAMGVPALMREGLSWRELRLRTLHAVPVRLSPAAEQTSKAGSSAVDV
jgi:phosphatidyl-myo-inositol alpha-mannosyltransferase